MSVINQRLSLSDIIEIEPIWKDGEEPKTPKESFNLAIDLIDEEWTNKGAVPVREDDALSMFINRFDGPIYTSNEKGNRTLNPELRSLLTNEERDKIKDRRLDILNFLWKESDEPYIKILKEDTSGPSGDINRAAYRSVRSTLPRDIDRSENFITDFLDNRTKVGNPPDTMFVFEHDIDGDMIAEFPHALQFGNLTGPEHARYVKKKEDFLNIYDHEETYHMHPRFGFNVEAEAHTTIEPILDSLYYSEYDKEMDRYKENLSQKEKYQVLEELDKGLRTVNEVKRDNNSLADYIWDIPEHFIRHAQDFYDIIISKKDE
tara:strand:- start:4802 stop:5755 length:954 start_codon:yes stop_codon:yes gene_type:complete